MDHDDWEEWDGRSPFWAHCVAGSLAGVVEHTAIYPLDTVRTHIQVCAACISKKTGTTTHSKPYEMPLSLLRTTTTTTKAATERLPLGMIGTIRYLMNEPLIVANAATTTSDFPTTARTKVPAGITRLFRGVQTILIGCVPAHALYFSSYEIVKSHFTVDSHVSTLGSSLAGAAAVTSHDLIMTPLDTLKQRMQLGHYETVSSAIAHITKTEGWIALYRSFPITLLTNIPYGMAMVTTNEACKYYALRKNVDDDRPQYQIILAASGLAGFVASAITTPLDRIKTCLQTQELGPSCAAQQQVLLCPRGYKHANIQQAVWGIWKREGVFGFWRGLAPRILSHTPAVAISWTTYETAKHYLLSSSSS